MVFRVIIVTVNSYNRSNNSYILFLSLQKLLRKIIGQTLGNSRKEDQILNSMRCKNKVINRNDILQPSS